ncbi:Imm72 family immunity protein [Acinetobacter courvalinii]|uniref:Imm72 family immunity protein n=1 Tax=Acinetobacter courvalinii TaxID=280147 RepID=A0AA42IDN3_9GAMM|nr:Imm72 family immunity protein [Acinetobacter courvalinii]MDH0563451.1 Imm72 family immunity protein [Acinetobacter courvalinii]
MKTNIYKSQAVNLNKMYSSYSFFKKIYEMHADFVSTFEHFLRNPTDEIKAKYSENYEKQYIMYLNVLNNQEKVLDLFFKTPYKNEIYPLFFEDGIKSVIFGRYGDEKDLANDPLYIELGMRGRDGSLFEEPYHIGAIKKLLIASEMLEIAKITVSADYKYAQYFLPKRLDKLFQKWNFESMFELTYWPLYKENIINQLNEPLEDKSFNSVVIETEQEVAITGIYEAKLDNEERGCPNYFYQGTLAPKYSKGDIHQSKFTEWYLIWEDKRYLDGTIPEEEKAYIFDIESIGIKRTQNNAESIEKLSIRAGQVCPKTGYWFTVAQENSRQYFKEGKILPEIKSDWGEVYWLFDGV